MENLLERITLNPDVMVGKPTVRGLRITVEQILALLANGISADDILMDFPDLQKDDIAAVLLYALNLVKEEKVFKIAV
jgi:uncharacterized protein (DUF433 family)